MISTIGYRASNSPPYRKTQFELGLTSPLQLSSSLFIASRRPSIPLSLKLLQLPTSPSGGTLVRLEDASRGQISKSIDQLPVEILCDIFSICDEMLGHQSCDPKVTLSHVCRHWRGIILCMPVLWSRLFVRRPNRTSVERLTAHFRRSGAHPIALTIIETVSASFEQRDAIKSLLPMIQTHALRIKSLSLSLRTSAPDFVTHLNDCQFPQLDALELSIYRCPKDLAEALMSKFQQGSRLSSLVWSRTENFPSNVSWRGLTRLELVGSYTLDTVCKILGQCRDLQQLVLDSLTDTPTIDAAVSLTALRNLEVHSHVPLGRFFGFLHAPSLRAVSIHYRMNANLARDWEHFGAFLLRSDCTLRMMVLWDGRTDDSQLTQFLQLSGLQSLAAIDIRQPVSDSILRCLTLSPAINKTDLLPLLKSITLSECNSADGILRDFVSSRVSHGPLDFFEVGLRKDQSKDQAYLRLLQDAGRDVRVYHY